MKEGWEKKSLNKISNYCIGLTYKPSDVNDNGTIVLRSSNIQNDKLDLSDIVRVSCSIKEALYVQKGDILMCSRNGSAKLVGKVAIIPETTERMTYGTFMMVIRSDYNPFLFYFFKSDEFRKQIKHGEANMINQITRYMLDDVVVNVPPLSEQQSIVEYLDSAFAKIDTMKANAEKALNEAQALFQASLKEMLEPKEGWEEKKLGEVIEHLRTGLNPRTHFKLNTPDAEGYYVTVRELKGFAIEPDDKTDKVNSAALKRINERSNLKIGDVLFSGTGTIGKTALVSELPDNWNIKEGVYAMTPKHSELDSKYFIYYIGSDFFLRLVNDKAAGTGVRSIPMKELVKLPISYPPLPEQQSIVATLDTLKSKVDKLQENFDKISKECDALKQSILRQIFE